MGVGEVEGVVGIPLMVMVMMVMVMALTLSVRARFRRAGDGRYERLAIGAAQTLTGASQRSWRGRNGTWVGPNTTRGSMWPTTLTD